MTSLTIGPPHGLVNNEVYALPARAVKIISDKALEACNDPAFASGVAAIAANTVTDVVSGFVRSTTGNAIVYLKAT